MLEEEDIVQEEQEHSLEVTKTLYLVSDQGLLYGCQETLSRMANKLSVMSVDHGPTSKGNVL